MNETTLITLLLVAILLQTTYLTRVQYRKTAPSRAPAIFVDTSVLMDGRIIHVAETGFIPGKLVIPRSVIGELQLLADGSDNEKRERARRGLDVVKALQAVEHIEVEVLQDGSKTENGVDDQLLHLAKKYRGMICTIDFNLNKVAQVEHIRVLNINELAQELRMSYLPGDHVRLELKHTGSDSHQAVGHLSDGTMVVVEQARSSIGKTVEVEIIRSLQTHAGRMMFARLVHTPASKSAEKMERGQRSKGRAAKAPSASEAAPTGDSSQSRPRPRPAKKPRAESKEHSATTADNRQRQAAASASKPARARRPKTSSQREDSLLKLVENQRS